MPIDFEQPQPFAPGIESAYGQTQQFGHDLPTLAGLYESAARMQQAGTMANADRAARMAAGNADRIQQGGEAQAALQQRQREGDQAAVGHANALDAQQAQAQAHLQAQFALQQQHAQLQMYARQQDITYQETQRLNQMRNSLAAVMDDPSLSPAEKVQAAGMLRSGIDLLSTKQQMTMQRRQQQADEMQKQQILTATAHAEAAKDLAAGNFGKRMIRVPNPYTGQVEGWLLDERGVPHQLHKPPSGAGAAGKGEKPFDIAKAKKDAEAEAELAHPFTSIHPDTNKIVPDEETVRKRAEYATKVFERERAAYQQRTGQAQPAQPEHFDWNEPRTQAQKDAKREWGIAYGSVKANDAIPPEKKAQALDALAAARGLLTAYGSVERMPPEARQQFVMYRNIVAEATQPPQQQPAAPQPSFYQRALQGAASAFEGGISG